ncbi:MAG TPA: DUF485 domain-containing protein [Solirubrobacteraceae bacterium]
MADYDWEALERSPEFRELIRRKRRFVLPATIGFLAWYIGFVLLAGYAEDFMGSEFLVDGLTVGYVLAFSQFVMVWGLAWLYLRKADRDFDPLEEKVCEMASRTNPTRVDEHRDRQRHVAGAAR